MELPFFIKPYKFYLSGNSLNSGKFFVSRGTRGTRGEFFYPSGNSRNSGRIFLPLGELAELGEILMKWYFSCLQHEIT